MYIKWLINHKSIYIKKWPRPNSQVADLLHIPPKPEPTLLVHVHVSSQRPTLPHRPAQSRGAGGPPSVLALVQTPTPEAVASGTDSNRNSPARPPPRCSLHRCSAVRCANVIRCQEPGRPSHRREPTSAIAQLKQNNIQSEKSASFHCIDESLRRNQSTKPALTDASKIGPCVNAPMALPGRRRALNAQRHSSVL